MLQDRTVRGVCVGGLVFLCLTLAGFGPVHAATVVFFNEIHYDNTGGDVNEGFEIAGPTGTDLTGWSVVLYNGGNGTPYGTVGLGGVLPDQQGGFGTLFFARSGLQNGAPDGLALVDASNALVQFLSYEGAFTAVGGAADGALSLDLGVSEATSAAPGTSLQLTGRGRLYEDFVWSESMPQTFGAVNGGQVFHVDASAPVPAPVPEPGSMVLLGSGLLGFVARGRRRSKR